MSFGDPAAVNAFFVDTELPPTGVEGYAIIAFNSRLQQYSTLATTVAWSTAPPLEIRGHEVLPNGSVNLHFDIAPGMIYSVWRAGSQISWNLTSDNFTSFVWEDTNPQSSNDYMLVALYPYGSTLRATFSNLYTVTTFVGFRQGSLFSSSFLDDFWGEYEVTDRLGKNVFDPLTLN